jgi:DNA invertase Pin-like site-specific DNA recombinase
MRVIHSVLNLSVLQVRSIPYYTMGMSERVKMIGYVRVSTNGQADNGHSLPAQRSAIATAAEQRGWEIHWIEDAASAKSLERSGMTHALTMLESGQAQGIVASKLDRLSRSTLDFATLLERAQKEEWNLVLLDLGLDLTTPMGQFTANVMVAAAQLERQLISERTKVALRAAKEDKGITPGPRSKVPENVIQRVRELNAQGLTLGSIANQLTQDRVPLPSGVEGVWQPVQVSRVLKRIA